MNVTTSRKKVGRGGPDPDRETSAPPNPVPLPERPETKELTIKLPTELAEEVEVWAGVNGVSIDEQMTRLVERALGRRHRQGGPLRIFAAPGTPVADDGARRPRSTGQLRDRGGDAPRRRREG
jgi:hypothetical protein